MPEPAGSAHDSSSRQPNDRPGIHGHRQSSDNPLPVSRTNAPFEGNVTRFDLPQSRALDEPSLERSRRIGHAPSSGRLPLPPQEVVRPGSRSTRRQPTEPASGQPSSHRRPPNSSYALPLSRTDYNRVQSRPLNQRSEPSEAQVHDGRRESPRDIWNQGPVLRSTDAPRRSGPSPTGPARQNGPPPPRQKDPPRTARGGPPRQSDDTRMGKHARRDSRDRPERPLMSQPLSHGASGGGNSMYPDTFIPDPRPSPNQVRRNPSRREISPPPPQPDRRPYTYIDRYRPQASESLRPPKEHLLRVPASKPPPSISPQKKPRRDPKEQRKADKAHNKMLAEKYPGLPMFFAEQLWKVESGQPENKRLEDAIAKYMAHRKALAEAGRTEGPGTRKGSGEAANAPTANDTTNPALPDAVEEVVRKILKEEERKRKEEKRKRKERKADERRRQQEEVEEAAAAAAAESADIEPEVEIEAAPANAKGRKEARRREKEQRREEKDTKREEEQEARSGMENTKWKYELVPFKPDRLWIRQQLKERAIKYEKPCFTPRPIREGYEFILRGNVYVTKAAKRMTKDLGKTVYLVYSSKTSVAGIQVPAEIHRQALELDELTREDRKDLKKRREERKMQRIAGETEDDDKEEEDNEEEELEGEEEEEKRPVFTPRRRLRQKRTEPILIDSSSPSSSPSSSSELELEPPSTSSDSDSDTSDVVMGGTYTESSDFRIHRNLTPDSSSSESSDDEDSPLFAPLPKRRLSDSKKLKKLTDEMADEPTVKRERSPATAHRRPRRSSKRIKVEE